MEEEFDDFTEEQVEALVSRFELAVGNAQSPYFDIEEFEEIIDYYDLNQNSKKLDMAIKTAATIFPSHIHFRIKEAQRLISAKRYNQAIDLLHVLLGIEPNNAMIRQTLAYSYSRMGKHKKPLILIKKPLNWEQILKKFG